MPSPADLVSQPPPLQLPLSTPPLPPPPLSVTPTTTLAIDPARPVSPSHLASPLPTVVQPLTDPNASLQSILAASKNSQPQTNGQLPAWSTVPTPSAHESNVAGPSTVTQVAGSKRKLEDPDVEDPHAKIRRIVRSHVVQDPSRMVPMTTVICLHAAVAQKSYGSEKRFLCPPPVVHIEGPSWQMRQQSLSMAVVSEQGERSFVQKSSLDNNMTANFKFLHVTGTAKAKSFQLTLDIAEPPASLPTEGTDAPPGRIWASFDSAPVTIISKPSKKTAKTRNISSCILAGGPVSLFNRINAQTVRTKYMTIDNAQLCASTVSWSAFNVNVVRRPTEAITVGGPQPVTYGCEITLHDTHTGVGTTSLIIRKVDKGRVSAEDGGPVSQMQKIVLQRVNSDGSRHYLSAAGPIPGTPGIVTSPTTSMGSQTGTHSLHFSSPRVRDETKDGVRVISDEVDDYLCWTIVGISKFQYTFFDAFGQNSSIPEMPITPFPTLFTTPVLRPSTNTLEMTVSNFFYDNPQGGQSALDVYLGNLGPLRHRIYQTANPGPLTSVSSYAPNTITPVMDGAPNPGIELVEGPGATPRYVNLTMHTIVMLEMPPIADVIKALEEDAMPSNGDISHNGSPISTSSRDVRNGVAGGGPAPSIAGRSLPLLFIRTLDGVGYHSGRTIACESVIPMLNLGTMSAAPSSPSGGSIDTGWLAAAQAAAAAAEHNVHGWTLRVM